MKTIKEDFTFYENMHEGLLRELLGTINSSLKSGVSDGHITQNSEDLDELVETMAFNIAAIIDGSAIMQVNGQDIHPHLTFKKSRDSDELIVNDTGSYLHEMTMGYLDEYDLDDL